MAAKRDYYEILGVDKNADETAIKGSYRKLAVKYHPDKNPDDEEAKRMFIEATEAYEVLTDKEKRAKYDQYGHAAFSQGGGGQGGFSGGFGGAGFDINDALRAFMNDFGGDSIFGDLFGSGRGGRRRGSGIRGNDLQVRIKLSLQEVHDGCTKKLKVRRKDSCTVCSGTGSKSGQRTSCPQCNGAGRVRRVANSLFGQVVQEVACPACAGEGRVVKDPCGTCGGSGRQTIEDLVSVDLPPGVAEGNYITVSGKGDEGLAGGGAGDLIVVIAEEESDVFERHGIDLFCTIDITFSEAALGTEKTIETLEGKVKLKIPEGSQSEKIFRLRAKGLPVLQSSQKGDMLVKIHVLTPEKLNREMKELFEKLGNIEAKPKNIFEQLKDIIR